MKPILFNTEMVRAILDGRKTVTRRVIKDAAMGMVYEDDSPARKPPYSPGDVLYVRETWAYHDRAVGGIIYKARCPQKLAYSKKWRPSIHMPKETARIFLRVTGVRMERLQDITVYGVQDEGLLPHGFVSQYVAMTTDCFSEFKRVWDSTIKPADMDKYGWDANPWVWVIEYERCEEV